MIDKYILYKKIRIFLNGCICLLIVGTGYKWIKCSIDGYSNLRMDGWGDPGGAEGLIDGWVDDWCYKWPIRGNERKRVNECDEDHCWRGGAIFLWIQYMCILITDQGWYFINE